MWNVYSVLCKILIYRCNCPLLIRTIKFCSYQLVYRGIRILYLSISTGDHGFYVMTSFYLMYKSIYLISYDVSETSTTQTPSPLLLGRTSDQYLPQTKPFIVLAFCSTSIHSFALSQFASPFPMPTTSSSNPQSLNDFHTLSSPNQEVVEMAKYEELMGIFLSLLQQEVS